MEEIPESLSESLFIQKKRKLQVSNEQKNVTSGPIDIETNQRGVFPQMLELDDPSEEDDELPFDGISYLKQVRIEAKQRPGIMTVHLPLSVLTESVQTINKTIKEEIKLEKQLTTCETKAYSFIWEEKFLEKFIVLRTSFSSLKTQSTLLSLPRNKPEWRQLILQALQAPTLSMLCCIDQYTALNLLKWNTGWLSCNSPRQQMIWIFFLLVKIDMVMTSDELSILRELCKKCLILRKSKTKLPLYIQSNIDMVISIVGNLFGQKDLLLK
ncbi:uncharacterized protein T551_01411 [Pneumocystis jirovecii RU7]|uniref:Gem-associated protein 2 n=1 Tax=Pneumocystis jirovecii (strain RU7) TaxID=1408657 RepID=A0A0W4ZSI1_PNEJ7|nr:uncharacterized protein T551_01411 [Pneumocystis jirovecii RU7]KTW31339.1 hypothetical protein T551_01411 [Pneumocystis jirovecii RU7]